MREDLVIVLFIVILIIGVVIGSILLTSAQCTAKATALGYRCEYHILSGCVLEKPDGKKILLEQLRDFGNE